MASAIMQLHARGSQDIATIVNPEVTFWKTVYPRHTNFAWDDTLVTQSTGTSEYGQIVEFKLPRSGDLVTKCTLLIEMGKVAKPASGWDGSQFSPFIWDFARALIEYAELTIGGYQIERITGDMLHILDITSRHPHRSYVENMPTQHGGSIKMDSTGVIVEKYNNSNKQFLYVPLEFSFTQDPGLALPMISLQYHEVRVKVKLSTADKIFTPYRHHVLTATNTLVSALSGNDTMGLRILLGSLYQRGIYGNEMTQVNETRQDLAIVNHVIEHVLNADKVTDLNVDTTKISFKLAAFGVVDASTATNTFLVPLSLIPNTERFTTTITTVENPRDVWLADPPSLSSVRLMCRYVYLDDFERRQFAVNSHEYLMTEYQHHQHFVTAGAEQVAIDLKFNHPTKELLFFYRPEVWWGDSSDPMACYKGYWLFNNPASAFGGGHLFSSANVVLNSQNVYGDGRDPVYFSSLVPSQYHARVWPEHRLYVIPFSLQPNAWRPTGSVNLSRLDDVKLVLKRTGTLPAGSIHVYAKNFNVIKIQNGMGGKRYAS